jgi:hypothetical protein
MLLAQVKSLSPIDKLRVLWSICLVDHYHSIGKKTSAYNIIQEFGSKEFEYWKTGCEIAEHYNLLDTETMKLTAKGVIAVAQWKRISDKIYAL